MTGRPPARTGPWTRYGPLVVALAVGVLAFVVISAFQVRGGAYVWRDPQSTTKSPFYIGLGSSVGVVLWAGAAVLCLFTWATSGPARRTPSRQGLLVAGALSAFLAIDDLCQVHEIVLPRHLGLSEPAVLAIYAVIAVVGLALTHRVIRDSGEVVLFVAAVALLVIEVAIDVVDTSSTEITGMGVVEDGVKFLGIVAWFAFWFRTCRHLLEPAAAGTLDDPRMLSASAPGEAATAQ